MGTTAPASQRLLQVLTEVGSVNCPGHSAWYILGGQTWELLSSEEEEREGLSARNAVLSLCLDSLTMSQPRHVKTQPEDFPGGPVVKTSPSNVGDAGSIPGWGVKIPHASWPKN